MSRDLVERAQRGDREAFAILAERSLARLVGTASLLLNDQSGADDAAQESLVKAWRDLPSLRDLDRWEAWLYRLLVRACHDAIRRRRHELPMTDLSSDGRFVADQVSDLADRDEIDRGLRRLTVDQRTVVVLRFYLGMSETQIGATLGIPTGTVKSRLHRALSAMRAELAADARIAQLSEPIR